MTAVNILLGKTECFIITDGAGTIPKTVDGRRQKTLWIKLPKVFPVPHLGLAMVFRGRGAMMQSFFSKASRARTVEDLRERLPIELRRRFGLLVKLFPWAFDFELTIAGVSDGKPYAFTIAATSRCGWKPFTVNEIDGAVFSPALRDESVANGWWLATQARSQSSLIDIASSILEHQRYSGIVGGFGQLTIVSQYGISSKIIKRWPDEYGKPLGPSAVAVPPQRVSN